MLGLLKLRGSSPADILEERLNVEKAKEIRAGKRPIVTEKIPQIHGKWWIITETRDGKKVKSEVRSNLILIGSTHLLAALLKNDVTFPNGIQYFAVGSGLTLWDTDGVPAPTYTDEALQAEIIGGRKVPDQVVYLDGEGDPSATPTGTILISTVLDYTDLPPTGVYIREFGLFGGNATLAKDTGLMIDKIHWSRIWKDENLKYTFFIQLEF